MQVILNTDYLAKIWETKCTYVFYNSLQEFLSIKIMNKKVREILLLLVIFWRVVCYDQLIDKNIFENKSNLHEKTRYTV